jgi:N utilization substance protein B
MGKRRQSRVLALQILYQHETGGRPLEGILPSFWSSQGTPSLEIRSFSEELVKGFLDNREEIEGLIGEYSRNWAPERIAVVDRNILRLAITELLHRNDIPPKVTINEYVDVAKKFSTGESGSFVNGILDRIHHEEGGRPGGGIGKD